MLIFLRNCQRSWIAMEHMQLPQPIMRHSHLQHPWRTTRKKGSAWGSGGRSSLDGYLTFYSARRPHSLLERRTLDQAYFDGPLLAGA